MIFSIIVVAVFVFAALVFYASCCAGSKADDMSEEYFALKEAEKRSENLKKLENSDII